MTAGHSPFLPALAPDFRLNPVKRLIPAARGGEIAIPCQPRAAPKAVVLWSKGTEILVNSSRYKPRLHPEQSPLLIHHEGESPSPDDNSVTLGWPDLLSPCCRVTVTPDGTLIIRNISRSDEGKYTCFAENFMGKANSTGILSVRGEGLGLVEGRWLSHHRVPVPPCTPALCSHFPPSLVFFS